MDCTQISAKPHFLWGLLLLGLTGCTSQDTTNSDIKIHVEEIWRIGGETTATESETDEFSFGTIADIEADQDGNLYVLDSSLWLINKYSHTGEVIQTIHLLEGEGPGEVINPSNIAVDSEGRIFLTSWEGLSVNIFDSVGAAGHRFHFPFNPVDIAVGNDRILIQSFWGSNESVLHVFNLEGQEIHELLPRPDDWMAKMAIGARGALAGSFDDRMYYSCPSPYRIVEIRGDGQLIRESSGQPEFEGKGSNSTQSNISSYSIALVILANGYVLSGVWDGDEYYFDLFSSELEFIKRFPITLFGFDDILRMTSDGEGNVYAEFFDETPGIVKFKVDIVRNSQIQ